MAKFKDKYTPHAHYTPYSLHSSKTMVSVEFMFLTTLSLVLQENENISDKAVNCTANSCLVSVIQKVNNVETFGLMFFPCNTCEIW